jgi:16S rRNA processing protein RimM
LAADRIVLAVITAPQGLQGEVRLKCFTADVDGLTRYPPFEAGGRSLALTRVRVAPNAVIARFAGITDRTQAEALRGLELAVPRSALPAPDPDEVYHADLIGLAVVTPSGAAAGRVVAVENYGAGDLLEIERSNGNRVLVPFRTVAVPEVDIPGGRITVEPDFLEA